MKKKKMRRNNAIAFAASLCLLSQMIPAGVISAEEEKTNAEFMYGDVNGDGAADITDMSFISLYLLRDMTLEGDSLKAADTNGDNEIDLRDLSHMKRFISKFAVTLGPQKETSSLKLKPASDWEEVYDFMKKGQDLIYYDEFEDNMINSPNAPTTDDTSVVPSEGGSVVNRDFSETYNQEENVLESDIVKTDGNAIYSFTYSKNSPNLNVVYAKDGKFVKSDNIPLTLSECKFGNIADVSARNMYLFNDMIIVLGTASIDDGRNNTSSTYRYYNNYTFVSAYKKGSEDASPELINTYYQEGYFNDVRITPDGFMYLITNGGYRNYRYFRDDVFVSDSDENAFDEDTVKNLIPVSGTNDEIKPIAPEKIFVPENPDDTYTRTYTVIGSIDFNSSENIKNTDTKVISGYTGKLYCSADNLYLTHNRYSYRFLKNDKEPVSGETSWNVTEITRISLDNGVISPEASGEVPGYIKDQFSMSEYDGYFRIVTTANYSIYNPEENNPAYYTSERSNNVFVLDENLSKVGDITHFAKDESVKSVSFAGNIGYIVTYVQTDPLFAVDFSDPKNPVILDEYKIDGYSTYMQKWDEKHLLGFGVSTYVNNYGNTVKNGYKLVMFDNSDPENLNEDGIYKLVYDDPEMINAFLEKTENNSDLPDNFNIYYYTGAEYERKSILIAPEKNLIGFPLNYKTYSNYKDFGGNGYVFFSYDDGEFTLKNFLTNSSEEYSDVYNRAVYIGDYVYIASSNTLVAADIETCTRTDEIILK